MDKESQYKKLAKELVKKMTIAEKISQMRYDSPAIERLNIPSYNWWNEALHGVARSGNATVFPQPIAMAASFNEKLLKDVGIAISDEARAKYNEFKSINSTQIYQGLTFWSPNINIFRDPRWGRGHETYGEDPLLTSKLACSFINGMQGNGKYRKVDTTLKHFLAHSGPEKGRHGFNSIVSEKDLYETYLFAFKYCIENSDPSAVMGAYNAINGEPCCASPTYLKKLLLEDLNFKGYVVSDCGAICDITDFHNMSDNYAQSAAKAVNNGCDLNCGKAYHHLVSAVAANLVSEEKITECVEKLFTARFRLGLFDDECEFNKIDYSVVDSKKHQDLNLQVARESIVLLKNDNILPLDSNKKIAVIGPIADSKEVLLGNYNGTPSHYTTILRGIQNYCKTTRYARGSKVFEESNPEWEEMPLNEAILAAKNCDITILALGLTPQLEGEEGDAFNSDMAGDKIDLNWPKCQRDLYNEIIKVSDNVILVNVSGSCIDLSKPKKDCKAIIQCFYPGAEGGIALSDIIFGKVSPSARLPISFYEKIEDLPPFEDYSMENRTYKYFKGNCVYNFGDGLTYNMISEEYLDKNTVKLINKGKYDINYSLLKFRHIPNKKLVAFKKIFLEANSETIVKIEDEI
ncbi:MAG: glycoside hydrolase family 3 C-terminal domain-containing protein [Pleomorphochaeta sp.]